MELSDVIKQQDFFREIVSKKEDFPNAMLFFCEDDETSKVTLVLTALALSFPTFELFNESSAEFIRFASGVDLDVKVYPKNGEKLLVSDSSEIVSEAYIKPVNLPRKIFIIHNMDVSTDEAQNKLLKVIEEPPENVVFLISAKSEQRVLQTIKSRCRKVTIKPLAREEVCKLCSDKLAVMLGGGYAGKTLKLAKKDDLEAIVKFAVSLFTELKNSKQVIRFSKKFLDFKGETDTILMIMALCVEDLLKIKCEADELCTLKGYNLADVEPEFSVEALCEIASLIRNLRKRFEFNAVPTVAVDNFLLKILEVKYLCK